MINITHEFLIEKLKSSRAISVLSIFSLCGFIIPFIPFLVLKEISANSLISFVFLFLIFGLPFGYFIGLKKIITTSKIHKDIKNKQIIISVDEIVSMKVSRHGTTGEMDDNYCKLYLKEYSKDRKSTVSVFASTFRKLKKGDQCILVFTRSEKYPVLVFAGNEYCVDEHLNNYINKKGGDV